MLLLVLWHCLPGKSRLSCLVIGSFILWLVPLGLGSAGYCSLFSVLYISLFCPNDKYTVDREFKQVTTSQNELVLTVTGVVEGLPSFAVFFNF